MARRSARQAAPPRRRRAPLSGSSSSHSGAPEAATRASVARFGWPGGEQPHRHVAQDASRPSASIASSIAAAPESQARVAAAARDRARGASSASASCARSIRARAPPQQAGGEPDQARFAASVGARDVQRLARPELQDRGLRTAAARRAAASTPLEAQQRLHATLSSSACMSSSLKPEMMADLVDQDVRDEMLERVARRLPIRRGSAGGTGGCVPAACPDCSTLRSVSGTPS